ncbi:interleukin-27 subunit beta [Neoarius graeffei]|uniref:interleukin-27 subunit beta n=1 Tax=Neoarius graeffei TaxID=443677 RepID=UPI00298CE9AD|nr:interleukin-27 subunit beta [Neoarius graeffei]
MRPKYSLYALSLFAFFHQISSQNTSQPKDLYVALGSSVELPCVDGRTDGSEWRLNGSFLVSSPVFRLHNSSIDDQGFYTCHDSNGEIVESVRLQLGYPPSIPDVQCWSPSYPLKALCSWTLPQDPILPTYYISTYRYLEDIYSCQRQSKWDRQCVLEGRDIFLKVSYLVNITAVNALGSASHVLPVIFEDIIKPDPPVNVKVTALPGKKLHVQWAPPPTWPDPVIFPLKYKVQFQWGYDNIASVMGPVESESLVRSGVLPGRMYHIRVSVMDFLGYGQSSDWSDAVNITLPRSLPKPT